ncbi:unnamed protein product [Ambrosiozyma monospora]|uniref:Unnamed protein product n=1 Tax=Ambrosiozyma monospora TaxID=43982 RepID=A0ACB5TZG8_AMBMO|nr:unnamed protein product [Ambrosiozyma monospora]
MNYWIILFLHLFNSLKLEPREQLQRQKNQPEQPIQQQNQEQPQQTNSNSNITRNIHSPLQSPSQPLLPQSQSLSQSRSQSQSYQSPSSSQQNQQQQQNQNQPRVNLKNLNFKDFLNHGADENDNDDENYPEIPVYRESNDDDVIVQDQANGVSACSGSSSGSILRTGAEGQNQGQGHLRDSVRSMSIAGGADEKNN